MNRQHQRAATALRAMILSLALLAGGRSTHATIAYRISLASPGEHAFEVTMIVPATEPDVTVAMPVWNALYQMRDFSQRIRDLKAACPTSAAPVHLHAIDKQTWHVLLDDRCRPDGQNVVQIRYKIVWDDPGPFDSQLNPHHAFLNLAEVLMYLPGRRNEDASLEFTDVLPDWKIVAALTTGKTPRCFSATSYDALVDAPVEAGKFGGFDFSSGGVPFHVVVDAENGDRDWDRLENGLKAITAYELRLMGGPPAFDSPGHAYTFIFNIGQRSEAGGGGMEHANSTAIAAPSVDSALVTAAHEFFHVWNVKRIRPQALEPVDYTKEQYTRALWFAEGVTSGYASFTLVRGGLWTPDQFFDDMAAQIAELQSRPARFWQSVEDSSLDAWLEKYADYTGPKRSISYYNKGQILGVLLDLAIRDATDNHRSLDDVMRRMNADYAGQHKFYDESAGVRAEVEAVAGKDFGDFFGRYISGTEEIPYDDFLAMAGLDLKSAPNGDPRFSVRPIAHPTERQRRILDGVLHGTTN